MSNADSPVEATTDAPDDEGQKGILGAVERIGNKVPHPALMFCYLILFIIVLSWGLQLAGVSVTEEVAVPVSQGAEYDYYEDSTLPSVSAPDNTSDEWKIVEQQIPIKSLISIDGIRFIFSSFVNNFAGFAVIGVTFVAMMGAGVAEESGLLGSLIRKLVGAAPKWALTFILVLTGVLSSAASDAGYLILIPLAAAAFASIGRHPLAGLATGFAGVATIFMVNVIPTPTDAMITEIANEAIGLAGGEPISIVANYWFMLASSFIIAFIAALVTERIVEPRLGPWQPDAERAAHAEEIAALSPEADKRGSRMALFGFLTIVAIVVVFTAPPGAPLRDPETGDIIGQTPFMDSLLFIIMLAFLVSGICYGLGAKTMTGSGDVIKAITKTFAGLGGMVLMLMMISQFIALFNWSNLPPVIAGSLAELLEQANIGAIPLLIGFILVIVLLDFIMPGSLPKWAIFAPIFVPLFMRLGVAPQTLLAAYRVADSPVNALTPLMVYLPFIVTVAQRYQKKAGIGTVVALMLPYSGIILVAWTVLFVAWFLLGIPLGPGYPPSVP
ncbi:MAG: AbgT family transporter [Propionicimonas sp.]|uniref:AbgT family transporter n=1 Tax=Propionicimonas sp. TaxID=1955623 RepID=UPI002B20A228|nr:AbgT family transporter [Propionicimonas sp.]MEA4944864.1 AbgT family transporter [Propionicimonas sp.]MEA5116470.1 AbgT family transporter [Propionicimonas sp.]